MNRPFLDAKTIDLSHTFDAAMPVYPGDAPSTLVQTAFLGEHGYNDFCLHSGMHVGTHMDAPLHMVAGGARISDIETGRFFGRGRLIDARGRSFVSEDMLERVDIRAGDILCVLTGWSKHFRRRQYYENFPEISPKFAERLVEHGVSILGLDTPTPDRPPFPVHKILLSHNILIIENLTNLEALLDVPLFDIAAAPVKFECEAAPVRVVAFPR